MMYRVILLVLLALTSKAQEFRVTRIPINYHDPVEVTVEKVYIDLSGNLIGKLVTSGIVIRGRDTLNLKFKTSNQYTSVYVYYDKVSETKYQVIEVSHPTGFVFYFTPLPPYKRKVYSIKIENI